MLAEIAPRFTRIEALRAALPSIAVVENIPAEAAFLAGHAHANYRRGGGARHAMLPDFLIGAHRLPSRAVRCSRASPDASRLYIPGTTLISPD